MSAAASHNRVGRHARLASSASRLGGLPSSSRRPVGRSSSTGGQARLAGFSGALVLRAARSARRKNAGRIPAPSPGAGPPSRNAVMQGAPARPLSGPRLSLPCKRAFARSPAATLAPRHTTPLRSLFGRLSRSAARTHRALSAAPLRFAGHFFPCGPRAFWPGRPRAARGAPCIHVGAFHAPNPQGPKTKTNRGRKPKHALAPCRALPRQQHARGTTSRTGQRLNCDRWPSRAARTIRSLPLWRVGGSGHPHPR